MLLVSIVTSETIYDIFDFFYKIIIRMNIMKELENVCNEHDIFYLQ